MFVVTVLFTLKPGDEDSFMPEMMTQARNSLALEKDCLVFDVCADESEPSRVFLYEVYTSKAAFDDHLQSAHFKTFSATVAPWLQQKQVETWTRMDNAA